MSSDLRRLARELAQLKSDVGALQRWASTPQLPASSLDDASVPEKDADGNVVSRWGRQEDGTHGLVDYNGPTPPTPSAPLVVGGPGLLTITWDGTLTNARPLDLHRIEAYAATEPFSYIEEADLLGSITGRDGGRLTVARDPGTWHVGLVAVSRAEKRSPVSVLAEVEVEEPSEGMPIEEILDKGFHTDTSPPTPADAEGRPEGAVWTMVDSEGADAARWRLVDGEWVEAPLSVQFIPEAYADYLAANAGFVGELAANTVLSDEIFAKNLNMTGELTALSDDFTTVLSQAGVQMFANNSLDFVQQWPVTGAPTSGGHVSGIASSGDYLYTIIPAEGSALSNPNQFRRYDLDGNDLGDTDSAAGWRFFELAANATHLYALAEEIGQVSPRHRRIERRALDGTLLGTIPAGSSFPNERVTRFAPMDDGNIVAVVLAPEHQRIELWDQNGNVIRVLEVIDSANWSVQYLTVDGQHVYYHIIFGWVGAPRYVRQLTTTGDHVRDIHLPSTVSSLSTYGNTLWVGLQQTGLLVAYNTATGAPTFISKLHDGDQAGNLQANNGHIYGINAFWNTPGPEPVIYQYEISSDSNLRVSLDNFEGRLVAPRINNFSTPTERDQYMGAAVGGATAVTQNPPMSWRMEGGIWVPAPGSWLLDEVSLPSGSLSGAAYSAAVLTIPPETRGMWRQYVIEGTVEHLDTDDLGTRPLSVRINGDSNAIYRSTHQGWDENGQLFQGGHNNTAFPRTAFSGRYEGNLRIELTPLGLGDTSFMTWSGRGWSNSGSSGSFNWQTGGRWNPPESQEIQYFLLHGNVGAGQWGNNVRFRLWGYR